MTASGDGWWIHRMTMPGGVWRIRRIAALLLLLLTACGAPEDPAPDVSVAWEVDPYPPRVGPTSVTMRVTDGANEPVAGARLELTGTMTHPGMQPVMGDVSEPEPGRYEAELNLTMGGDWILLLEMTLQDGRVLHRQRELRGVRVP